MTISPDDETQRVKEAERGEAFSKGLPPHLILKSCRHGYMLYFNTDLHVGQSLTDYGEWAEAEVELFQEFITPGMIVVEAGANVGTHTLALSQLVGAQGRVYAFEPQPRIFQLLCANLALNDIDNVRAYPMGVGDCETTLFLAPTDYSIKENFAGIGLEESGEEPVEVRTVDAFDFPAIDFLKIDVEAMELKVLKGAEKSIARSRPVVFVENDRMEESCALISALMELEYRMWWHLSRTLNEHNFLRNPTDIWDGEGFSNNMICIPQEKCSADVVARLQNLREVISSDETWEKALQGRTRVMATR